MELIYGTFGQLLLTNSLMTRAVSCTSLMVINLSDDACLVFKTEWMNLVGAKSFETIVGPIRNAVLTLTKERSSLSFGTTLSVS